MPLVLLVPPRREHSLGRCRNSEYMITYQYGRVCLQFARTIDLSFVQDRDPFGVDSMYTTYRIYVKGFLSESEGQFPGAGGTAISSQTLNAVKAELETPRLPMAYKIGTDTIVEVLKGQIDAKIGPEPLPCRITEVNTGTFMVECGCIVRVVDCDDICNSTGGGLGLIGGAINGRSPILSLRWTQTESFDENWYSHLETSGHVIVRSDFLLSADNYRAVATPPLLSDYIRTVSRYTLSPDGLMLNFHFEDVERDRLPPFPATKAQGTYVVEVNKGTVRYGTVHIRLEGQKGTSRKQLLVRACQMAYSKLNADRFLTPTAPVISGRFVEDQFDPVVEVQMSALMSNICKNGVIDELTPAQRIAAGAALGTLVFPGIGTVVGAQLAAVDVAAERINSFVNGGSLAAAAGTAAVAMGFGGDTSIATQIMPSVGFDETTPGTPVTGLASGKPGIAPPDRKRIAGLLTAMFRDPCLCLESNSEAELRSGGLPTTIRNPDIVNPVENPVTPPVGGSAGTPSIIEIGITTVTSGVIEGSIGLLRDSAVYNHYEIETNTVMDSGNLQMPGTGVGHDGGVSAIVTAHGGMMKVMTTWVASRIGKPPQLPTYESPDPNVVPITGSVVAKDVVPNADGTSITYMIAGYYVHAIKDPSKWQIAPPVAPNLDQQVRVAAAKGASFWTDTALWSVVDGVVGGLALTTNANPFVSDGVSTTPQPTDPPGFDLSNLTGDQLNNIIQTGSSTGQTPTPDYFYHPPINP